MYIHYSISLKQKSTCTLTIINILNVLTKRPVEVPKVILNGEQLPWVPKAKHLGNTLTSKISSNPQGMDTTLDLLQKRAIFFQKFRCHEETNIFNIEVHLHLKNSNGAQLM